MSGVGEVLFFRNSRFSCQILFWIVFLMILAGFGSHFGSQNGTKMRSKINEKFDGFLDRSWKGSGVPKGIHEGVISAPPGSTGKSAPYCRANLPWPRRPMVTVSRAWPFLGLFLPRLLGLALASKGLA